MLKTGIPTRLLREAKDPFAELNDLIQNHDQVAEAMSERYTSTDFAFAAALEDVFIVPSLSGVMMPKARSPFAKLTDYIECGVDHLVDAYGYILAPMLVHADKHADIIYLSGNLKFLPFEDFGVPFVKLTGKEEGDYFFVNLQNFIKCIANE